MRITWAVRSVIYTTQTNRSAKAREKKPMFVEEFLKPCLKKTTRMSKFVKKPRL